MSDNREFSRPDGHDFVPPMGPVDPAHPECASVVAEVETLLDGECTDETRDRLKQHLEECPTCLDAHGLAVRVKRLVATKCSGEKAPEGLRARLQVQISRTTIITESR
jgi:mycothiol system anti-sigma-R factor